MPTLDPYAPPPMLPRPWLPLPPGTIIGTPSSFPAPNPFGINWPKAQLANPSFVGSRIRYAPVKPVPRSEYTHPGDMRWPQRQWAGDTSLGSLDTSTPTTSAAGVALAALLAIGAFVVVAEKRFAPPR